MSATLRFGEVFRGEHRAIRDALLNLIRAFRNRDVRQVRRYLAEAAALSGPHFRYEEEALYPSLAAVLDDEPVGKMVSNHDRAIATMRNLLQLASLNELTRQDAREGAWTARSLLRHLFECDGLSIMAELLPQQTMQRVLDVRDRSLQANLDVLHWDDTVRHAA